MAKKPKYEFYVVQYDINSRKIGMENVFRNWVLSDRVEEDCRKYLRQELTYDELKKEIDTSIMWQEWSRVQYEISAGDPFPKSVDELTKIDAYYQAKPNLDLITKMCIERTSEVYKPRNNKREQLW